MLSPRWRKVLRDLKDNRSRTLLSILSIAVGVTAFGGMMIARDTIITNLNLAYSSSNPTDLTIDLASFDHELLRWVKTQPGVQDAAAMTVVNGVVEKADGADQDITLFAFADYPAISLNKLKPVSGQYPPARGVFLLERASVGAAGLTPGMVVRLRLGTDKRYAITSSGALYDVSTPAGPAAARWNLYIDERTLSDLDLDARPNRLIIRSAPGITVEGKYVLADRLTDALGRRGLTVRAVNVNERSEHWAAGTAGGILLILVLVGGVTLLLSGFLIINVVNGLLLSQKKIIGIMKIVGGDRWQIFGVYLTMMASLGLLALMLALPVSALLGNAVARLIATVINFDVVVSGFTWRIAVMEAVVAILVPVAFSAGPIWSALQSTAAQAISEVAPRQKANPIERLLAKLENIPRIVTLAFRSLFRNTLRLAMTALTLIVAGGIFIAILNLRVAMPSTIARSLDVNNADVTITLGAPIPRIAAVNRALQDPGVTYAEGWIATQSTVVRADGDGSTLLLNGGADDSRFVAASIDSGRWLSPYSLETRDEIVLSVGVLDSEPDLRLGGTVTLKRGGASHTFRIVGFVRRTGGAAASTFPAYGHYETISRFAGLADMATSVRVRSLESGKAYTDQLVERLRVRYEDANVPVVNAVSRATLQGNVISAFNIIVTLMIIVAALIAVVGGLGLAGTMSLSVMERTREVGVMRAVGAQSPDLRAMFVVEGLFIGLLSALISYVLSVPLTRVIGEALGAGVRIGAIDMQFSAAGYLLWPVIVSVVSVVASLSPARRASQISIREALAYA
jgi:putative ABC transport system permease protein